jgi:hypothetical protein
VKGVSVKGQTAVYATNIHIDLWDMLLHSHVGWSRVSKRHH